MGRGKVGNAGSEIQTAGAVSGAVRSLSHMQRSMTSIVLKVVNSYPSWRRLISGQQCIELAQ